MKKERPLKCSQCQKEATVLYSEIKQGTVTTYSMCQDCPFMQLKLHGTLKTPDYPNPGETRELLCGKCQTHLESVLMNEPLGCGECYAKFHKVLVDQLIKAKKISSHLKAEELSSLHVGKSPCVTQDPLITHRILELNTALEEALNKENYEQAAWLRDRIHALMEQSPDDA